MERFPRTRKPDEGRGLRCTACGTAWRHWMAIDLMQIANRCLRCGKRELQWVAAADAEKTAR